MSAYSGQTAASSSKVGDIVAAIVGWTFVGCIIGAIVYLLAGAGVQASGPGRTTYYSTKDYLRAAGLNPGRWENLKLGQSINGSTGNFTSSTWFFLIAGGNHTSGQIQPGSAVRLSLQAKFGSYILEIPYNQVRFQPKAGAKDAVRFVVHNTKELDKRKWACTGKDFWTYTTCHLSKTPPNIYKTKEWAWVSEEGLPKFINDSLVRVDIRLTPAQYTAYLGSLQQVKG
ncbi:MAG TPA: hypothetical protein VFT49_00465 [Candidatus Saccharimonadales bacterium]|nr:hypothetical protein [Candidatus Saccharimonadales bacterium]